MHASPDRMCWCGDDVISRLQQNSVMSSTLSPEALRVARELFQTICTPPILSSPSSSGGGVNVPPIGSSVVSISTLTSALQCIDQSFSESDVRAWAMEARSNMKAVGTGGGGSVSGSGRGGGVPESDKGIQGFSFSFSNGLFCFECVNLHAR